MNLEREERYSVIQLSSVAQSAIRSHVCHEFIHLFSNHFVQLKRSYVTFHDQFVLDDLFDCASCGVVHFYRCFAKLHVLVTLFISNFISVYLLYNELCHASKNFTPICILFRLNVDIVIHFQLLLHSSRSNVTVTSFGYLIKSFILFSTMLSGPSSNPLSLEIIV